MTTDKECIEYARECERLAGLTTDPELQERFLEMARNWMRTATDERHTRAMMASTASPKLSRVSAPSTKSRGAQGWTTSGTNSP